jgi:hypothetical protein
VIFNVLKYRGITLSKHCPLLAGHQRTLASCHRHDWRHSPGRVTRWCFETMVQIHYLSKSMHNLNRWKSGPYFTNFSKALPKVSNHPIGENSHNLVTLTRRLFLNRIWIVLTSRQTAKNRPSLYPQISTRQDESDSAQAEWLNSHCDMKCGFYVVCAINVTRLCDLI